MTWISIFSVIRGAFGARHLGDTSTQRLSPERHSYPEGIVTRGNEAFGEHDNLGRQAFGKTRATRAFEKTRATRTSRPEAGYPKDTSHTGAVRGMRVARGAGHLRVRDIREVREHRQSRGTGRSEDARHPGTRHEAGRSARSPLRSPNLLANSPTTCGFPRMRRACDCRRRCLCERCA